MSLALIRLRELARKLSSRKHLFLPHQIIKEEGSEVRLGLLIPDCREADDLCEYLTLANPEAVLQLFQALEKAQAALEIVSDLSWKDVEIAAKSKKALVETRAIFGG